MSKTKTFLKKGIVYALVLCLAVTALILVSPKGLFKMEADAAVTLSTWPSSFTSGQTYNITLENDWNTSNTGNQTTAVSLYTAVPAGVTVNLNLNGHSIFFDAYRSNNEDLITQNYSDPNNTAWRGRAMFWGLLRNSGTLNITNSSSTQGSIGFRMASEGCRMSGGYDNFIQRSCTILNNSGATLSVGSNVKIFNYCTFEAEEASGMTSNKLCDGFLYAHGIRNDGTVNLNGGLIDVGCMFVTISPNGNNSYACACAYGIYGGTVNTTGGQIIANAYSGSDKCSSACKESNRFLQIASGIVSNNATVLGNTTINTYTGLWQASDSYDNWSSGSALGYSNGVMYFGTNYPKIGAGVSITSTAATKTGETLFPGYTDKKTRSMKISDNCGTMIKSAAPVAGYGAFTTYLEGSQTVENMITNASGATIYFGSGSECAWDTGKAKTNAYYGENSFRKNASSLCNLVNECGANESLYRSQLREGGSQNGSAYTAEMKNGAPGTVNGQYIIMYRYYDQNGTLQRVSYTPDSAVNNAGVIKSNEGADAVTGVNCSSTSYSYKSGGASVNSFYYSWTGVKTESVAPASYITRSVNDPSKWTGGGAYLASVSNNVGTATGTANTSSSNMLIIYFDYRAETPSYIRIAVADKGNAITYASTSKSATMDYTGAPAVPNTDFRIAVISMGPEFTEASNDVTNDKIITSRLNTWNPDRSPGYKVVPGATTQAAINVSYKYKTGSSPYTEGLPSNAGTYTIEVTIADDINISTVYSANRKGGVFTFTLTINPASVTIAGLPADNKFSGTYGDNYGSIVNFSNLSAKGINNVTVEGQFAFATVSSSDIPNASTDSSGVQLTVNWTPTGDNGNYKPFQFNVFAYVAKRQITVKPGTAQVTYGDTTVNYLASSVVFVGGEVAPADASLVKSWIDDSVFGYRVENTGNNWINYEERANLGSYAVAGDYGLGIVTFGGSANPNYTFTVDNSVAGTFTVNKKDISFDMITKNRDYNGKTFVDVKFNYVSGLVSGTGDQFIITYNEKEFPSDTSYTFLKNVAVMQNADAGTNKIVTVDTSLVPRTGSNNNCYNMVINNSGTCYVNIEKATPQVPSVNTFNITYDSSKDINTLVPVSGFNATVVASYDNSVNVFGTWTWKQPGVVPTVNTNSYTATFTPDDVANFKVIEKDISVTVAKAVITVAVAEQNIKYGDPIPTIGNAVTYTGFTGLDNLASVQPSGTTDATTTYRQGNGVGSYPITVVTTYVADNYEFVVSSTVSNIIVGKKDITVKPNDDEIVYGSTAPTYNASNVTVTGLYGTDTVDSFGGTLLVSTEYINGSHAGNYDIICSGWNSTNYNLIFGMGTLKVNKAVLTVTPKEVNITYGADKPNFEPEYTGFVGGDYALADIDELQGSVVYNTNYVKGSNAGVTYTVSADATGLSSKDYTFVGASNNVNVNKAMPEVVSTPSASITFTQALGSAVFTDGTVLNPNDYSRVVAGSFAYNNVSMVPEYDKNGTAFSATFTPVDTVNYEIRTVSISLTINEKDITGIPVIAGSAMVGQTLNIITTSMDPNNVSMFNIQWNKNGNPIGGMTGYTYSILEGDKNSAISVTLTAKDGTGYTGSATSVATALVIEHLTPVGKDQLDYVIPTSLIFDNDDHPATVSVKSNYSGYVGAIRVYYNGSTELPKNAGTYLVTVDIAAPTITGDPSNYYGPVSGLVLDSFTISPKDYNVTFTAVNKVYDGTNVATVQNVNSSDKIVGTDVTLSQGTFVFDSKDVGTDIIVRPVGMTLNGADKNNYNLVVTNDMADITPATLTAEASAVGREYNGSSNVDVTFSKIAGYVNGESSASISFTNGKGQMSSANAGTNDVTNITYTATGLSKDNYVLEITNASTVKAVISKATPVISAPVISGYYYNKARTLGQISLDVYSNSIGKFVFADTSEIPVCNKTSYDGRFIATDSNYKDVDCTITLILNKTNVTLNVDNKVGTYGQNAPAYTISPDGLTGNDTLETEGVFSGYYTFLPSYTQGQVVGPYNIGLDISTLASENYTFTVVPGTLQIMPATINATVSAVNKAYDGTKDIVVNFAITDGKYGNDNVALSYSQTIGTATSANAGGAKVSYVAPELTGTKASNYILAIKPASGVLTVVIEQADPIGVVFPSSAEMTFGTSLSDAVFTTEGYGDGTFKFVDGQQKPTSNGAFSYAVQFKPTDRNYKTVEQNVTVIVNIAKIDFVVGVAGSSYAGSVLTPVITGAPEGAKDYMSFEWYREKNGNLIAVGNEPTYTTTEEDKDCLIYVLVYFEDDSPYQFNEAVDTEALVLGGEEGLFGCTTSTIQEKFKTFWERLLEWWRSIIEIITNIRFTF